MEAGAMPVITRDEIKLLLQQWQSGHLTAEAIHVWAESNYLPGDVSFIDWEGPTDNERSVACEVLAALDRLDMNLMLAEDIPVYLNFLSTPSGSFDDGFARFEASLRSIDYSSRRIRLLDDPLYSPFCT
jgi:hypothetical protein